MTPPAATMTERWRELRHSEPLKLAGFAIVAVYAVPWFVYGVAATQRDQQEDNGLWLIAFSGALVAVGFLGLRLPVLAASILIVPSVLLWLLVLAWGGPSAGALFLLLLGAPLAAGALFVLARFHTRRVVGRSRVAPRRF